MLDPCLKTCFSVALRFLLAPPTSVPSERLLAGDIYDEKRNGLSRKRAESLLFIKNKFNPLNSHACAIRDIVPTRGLIENCVFVGE